MRQWVEAALQTRLRSVDPLTGGWTSTMLLDFIKAPRRLAAAPFSRLEAVHGPQAPASRRASDGVSCLQPNG
jgi:hypothetical protein